MHRQGKDVVQNVISRLTPELSEALVKRGAAYAQESVNLFHDFTRDARTHEQIVRAEAGLKELEAKSR